MPLTASTPLTLSMISAVMVTLKPKPTVSEVLEMFVISGGILSPTSIPLAKYPDTFPDPSGFISRS